MPKQPNDHSDCLHRVAFLFENEGFFLFNYLLSEFRFLPSSLVIHLRHYPLE
jgi:hypothetical protein